MRHREIKLGQSYWCYDSMVIAEGFEEDRYGKWVLVRDPEDGDEFRTRARGLIPEPVFLQQQKEETERTQELEAQAEKFIEALGEGCQILSANSRIIYLTFSEQAAAHILFLTDAQPLKHKQWPSKATPSQLERRCATLSRRLRSALGYDLVGSGSWGRGEFDLEAQRAAIVAFDLNAISEAAKLIGEANKAQTPEPVLADIL